MNSLDRRNSFRLGLSLLVLIILVGCYGETAQIVLDQRLPRTIDLQASNYSKHLYVSVSTGSDENDGTQSHPWASLNHALTVAPERSALHVAVGSYNEGDLQLKSNQAVFGGYSAKGWQRDINSHPTIVNGEGEQRLFIGADGAWLDGLTLTQGLVRGHGAALTCVAVDMTVSNCWIKNNRSLGPEEWNPVHRHEISNDGGAIYAADGADLILKNNVFAYNTTENGRGAALALHSNCNGEIVANVFYANISGDNDPKRSSDGGALSIFDWSSPLVEDNLFLANEALTKNDAGGIFVALWSSPLVRKNVFVQNISGDDAGAIFVGGQEHRYDGPLDPIPPKNEFYVRIEDNVFHGNRNNAGKPGNSGVMRFTMESRGSIAGNIMAENPGFYIQRSEVEVRNNTILEPFIFIETKEGLKPSYAEGNIISDTLNMDEDPAPVSFIKNIFSGDSRWQEENTHVSNLKLDDEPFVLNVVSAEYSDNTCQTVVLLRKDLELTNLQDRVIRSGEKWGIISSIQPKQLIVWGDLGSIDQIEIMPTYKPLSGSPSLGYGVNSMGEVLSK
jgi:hypothetical protein